MIPKLSSLSTGLILIITLCLSNSAISQKSNKTQSDDGEVVSLHLIKLKQGVDTLKFEQWVRERFNPSFANLVSGFKFYIAKIDRGTPEQIGKYLKVILHSSKNSRNKLWPQEGKPDKDNTAPIYKAFETLWNEYSKYIDDTGYAEYVELR